MALWRFAPSPAFQRQALRAPSSGTQSQSPALSAVGNNATLLGGYAGGSALAPLRHCISVCYACPLSDRALHSSPATQRGHSLRALRRRSPSAGTPVETSSDSADCGGGHPPSARTRTQSPATQVQVHCCCLRSGGATCSYSSSGAPAGPLLQIVFDATKMSSAEKLDSLHIVTDVKALVSPRL